jgi:hypothetical protein
MSNGTLAGRVVDVDFDRLRSVRQEERRRALGRGLHALRRVLRDLGVRERGMMVEKLGQMDSAMLG